MAKRVYFAFHYQDVIDFRANVVRNHWLTKPDRESAGFFDASVWESAKRTSELAVKRLINGAIQNTTVTCVLIGSETFKRRWVRYEIMKSIGKGNKIFGVHINGILGKDEKIKSLGPSPFDYLSYEFSENGNKLLLYEEIRGKWADYGDLSSYSLATIAPQNKWGKWYRLSSIYPVYNWVKDGGYNNCANWVG
jgi:hypothetical protein